MRSLIKILFSFLILISGTSLIYAQEFVMQQVGTWPNITSFTINHRADHIIMVMRQSKGLELVYESRKESGNTWSEPQPIEVLNRKIQQGAVIGGLSLSFDEKTLYFHSNMYGGKGNMDIYMSCLTTEGWGEPVAMEELNSEFDDTYPSVAPGAERIFFLRHQVMADERQEKKEASRMTMYQSVKDEKGKYSRPLPTNNSLNEGWVQDVTVGKDGATIYFSNRVERKEVARILFTRELMKDSWLLPETLFSDESSYDYYQAQEANGELYILRSNNKKQDRVGGIYHFSPNQRFLSSATVEERGGVFSATTRKPLKADLKVYNPTTMQLLGAYESYAPTGEYDMSNREDAHYFVDVRSEGHSYASYMLDYPQDAKSLLPEQIELFDTISLNVAVYDNEIFRPLESKIIAVRQSDKSIFRSTKCGDGIYNFKFALGSSYNVIATAPGFDENKFMFRLEGDIVFSQFLREMPMSPQKKNILFKIVDAETNNPLNASIVINNRNREERIVVGPDKVKDGTIDVLMREGDKYDVTVSGVTGYSFATREIAVKEAGKELVIPLIPLRSNVAISLNNINFDFGSADLLPASYTELDRLVKLMKENPMLKFEISAHTDNSGTASYNLKLSDMRAVSVIDYLVESGISIGRLLPKGYGMFNPKVPNTTEENKAINRRVEFMLIESEIENK